MLLLRLQMPNSDWTRGEGSWNWVWSTWQLMRLHWRSPSASIWTAFVNIWVIRMSMHWKSEVKSHRSEDWTYVCDRKYSIVWASVPKLMACHWMWCDLWQLHFGNNFTACSLLELIMLCSIKLLILYDKYDEYDEYDKVNRCLARYSPRATTTNQPTNRAPNGPARPGKNAKFGRSWAKNPNFYWRNQKFCSPPNGIPT